MRNVYWLDIWNNFVHRYKEEMKKKHGNKNNLIITVKVW